MRRRKIKDPLQVPLPMEECPQQEGKLGAEDASSPPPEPNQKKDVEEEELGKAAMAVFSWLYAIARSACAKGKIQPEHLPTLQALEKGPPANLTDLGKKVGVHPTTVKRQMNVLEKNGVGAVRQGRVNKKKAMIAEITPAGRQELGCCRSRLGSELKGSLEQPSCDSDDLGKALRHLVAILKAAPH